MELEERPFELVTLIGRGANSDVYLATLSPSERLRKAAVFPFISSTVAVKVFHSATHEEVLYEANLMRKAAHPNICAVYGLYCCGGKFCLMLEYFVEDLFDFTFSASTGAIEEPCALSIFTSLLLAVEHLHSLNIVHGDIKMENALIAGTKVCLSDFGKTKRVQAFPVNWQPGTLLYAAPEMLSRRKVAGPEVDIWALGIVLFCLVEGSFPYYADTKRSLRRVLNNGHRYVRASPPVRALIDSMLNMDPVARSTAAGLLTSPAIAQFLPPSLRPEEVPIARRTADTAARPFGKSLASSSNTDRGNDAVLATSWAL